uniref:NADH dehydrogenase subunit 6 n=1 Tax=Megalyra sp. MM-2014 TaxID=1503221 RepID=A0A096XKZ7_9HYME|nr:NADH dehydrogenase subunit 6 [Megalyra sp. MM-2014]
MYSTTFLLIIMLLIFLVFFMNKGVNPMILGFMLLLFSMLTPLMIFKSSTNYFLSMIFHLVIVGGVLILFMYFISLTPNFFMKILYGMNMNYFIIKLIMFILTLMILLMTSSPLFYCLSMNIESYQYAHNNFYMFDEVLLDEFNLWFIYTWIFMYISLFLIMYLFLMMLVVVKICSKSFYPLRINL